MRYVARNGCLFLCWLLTVWCNAQTILAPGDAAFVGIAANIGDDDLTSPCENGAGSERDRISFLCFKDITPNTAIDLTDNGWERRTTGKWGNSEGFLRMVRTGPTIPAGMTITIELPTSAGSAPLGIGPDNGWTFIQTGILNFNSGNGDQLYLLQDGNWDNGAGCPGGCQQDATYTGGRVICAFTNVGWLSLPPGTVDLAQRSRLHPDISTCFAPSVPGDFISYKIPQTATTQPVWTARFRNAANWANFTDCTAFVRPPDSIFLVKTVARLDCISNCKGCVPLTSSLRLNLLVPISWGPFTLTYTDGTTNRVINNAFDGLAFSVTSFSNTNYSIVSVTAGNGCPVPFTYGGNAAVVTENRPVIQDKDTLVCAGAKIDLLSLVEPRPDISYTFHTAPNPNGTNILPNPSVTVNNAITYYGQALTPTGCRDTFPVHFSIQPAGVAGTSQDTLLCANDVTSVFSLYETSRGATFGGTWSARPGDGNDPGNLFNRADATLSFNNLSTGNYAFTYTAPCNPLSKANVMVYVRRSPKVTVNIAVTNCTHAITLTPVQGTPPWYFDWDDLPGTTNTPDRIGLLSGNYLVAVVDSNYCSSSQIVTLLPLLPDTVIAEETTCDPTVTGTRIQRFKKLNGCDSLLITHVRVLSTPVTWQNLTTCNPLLAGTAVKKFAAQNGCDSLVIIKTALLPSDTIYINKTHCDPLMIGISEQHFSNQYGCDSLVVTTTTLLPSDTVYSSKTTCDPLMTGIREQRFSNQYGCDSLVVTTTTLLPSDTVYSSKTHCDPLMTGIREQRFSNQYGCDSLVVTITMLLPSDTVYISKTTCDPLLMGIKEQYFSNQYGCDSLVVTTTTLLPSDTVYSSKTTCDPLLTGIKEQYFSNQYGCDSLVVTTTTLLPSDTVYISKTTCDPLLTGIKEQYFSNQYGCDSLVVITTTLLPSDTVYSNKTHCDPLMTGIREQRFSNQYGCDSLVVTITTLLPSDTLIQYTTTCNPAFIGRTTRYLTNYSGCDSVILTITALQAPDSFFVRRYTCDPSLAGSGVRPFKSVQGCDSIVTTTTVYVPPVATFLEESTCRMDSAGIFSKKLVNWGGCDSMVNIQRNFIAADSIFLHTITCDPLLSGIQIKGLVGSSGCDSIVITAVDLLPTPSTYIDRLSCDLREVGVKIDKITDARGCDSLLIISTAYSSPDTTYQKDSTCNIAAVGRFIRHLTNRKGCDSVIILDVRQIPNPESIFKLNLCNGTFMVINGHRYDVKNRNGREVLHNAASNGCDSIVNVQLLYSFLDLKLSWYGPTCYQGRDGSILIDTIRNGIRPYTIRIDGFAPIAIQAPFEWPGLAAGPHHVYVEDAELCIFDDTLLLPAPPQRIFDPGATASIPLGDSLKLQSIRNFEPAKVIWQPHAALSCTTCLEPVIRPLSTAIFAVTAFDSVGCSVTNSITVAVEKPDDVYIANVFTPVNNGQNNDIWVSCGPSVAEIRRFAIFDRWGNMVFECHNALPNDAALRWNGQFNGRNLPPAVYIYQVEVSYIDGRLQLIRGDITLTK